MSEYGYKILKTTNYNIFKRLEGNRPVPEQRVKKIISSIKKVGYVISPVIVNENYEVIDGQGRVEALKRLGLPVFYIVDPGKGIDECIAMNINQTNWTMLDYIKSHAETGNVSYQNILTLIERYGEYFKLKVILYAVNGKIEQAGLDLKEGRLVCTDDTFAKADRRLSWLMNFISPLKGIQGHVEYYLQAMLFCYEDPEVDNERLIQKITMLQANLKPVTQIQQAFEYIEDAYNNRSRNKVYIKTNYRKYLDGKYGWYDSKYGKLYSDERTRHDEI